MRKDKYKNFMITISLTLTLYRSERELDGLLKADN